MNNTTAEFGIWWNGTDIVYLHRLREPHKFEEIPDIPRKGETLEDVGTWDKKDLKPATELIKVFDTIHNHIYANEGLLKEKVFNEMLKFIFMKMVDEKLPDEYKSMLKTAMKAASADMYIENFAESAVAWDKMKQDYPNIKVKSFPLPVIKALKKSTDEVLEGYASKNELFKEIWENQKEFMKKARKWSLIEEYGYIKTTLGVE